MSDGTSIQELANANMRLGRVVKRWTDILGHQCRARISAIVVCPTCGKDVALTSETEEWVCAKGGKWVHRSYDCCPSGECCGKAIIYNGLDGRVMVLE